MSTCKLGQTSATCGMAVAKIMPTAAAAEGVAAAAVDLNAADFNAVGCLGAECHGAECHGEDSNEGVVVACIVAVRGEEAPPLLPKS